MSIKCVFMDNEVYGADDVNQIFSRLTTQGVSLFKYTDGDNPLLDLNTAVAGYVTPGVDSFNNDSCKVYYDSSNDRFFIHTGLAFMNDGSVIEINDEDYDITSEVKAIQFENPDASVYVYFKRFPEENTIKICVDMSEENLADESVVTLAVISGESAVSDLREYAHTKVAPCSENIIITGIMQHPEFYSTYKGDRRKVYEIDGVFRGARYVYMVQKQSKGPRGSYAIEIQEVEAITGDELEYTLFSDEEESEYIAFNRRGTTIEVWRKTTAYVYVSCSWKYMIF